MSIFPVRLFFTMSLRVCVVPSLVSKISTLSLLNPALSLLSWKLISSFIYVFFIDSSVFNILSSLLFLILAIYFSLSSKHFPLKVELLFLQNIVSLSLISDQSGHIGLGRTTIFLLWYLRFWWPFFV